MCNQCSNDGNPLCETCLVEERLALECQRLAAELDQTDRVNAEIGADREALAGRVRNLEAIIKYVDMNCGMTPELAVAIAGYTKKWSAK